jgi:hypothetical protein
VTVRFWLTINEPPPEGWIGRHGLGEGFRTVWFRAPLIDRRKLRRAAVPVGALAFLVAYRWQGRRKSKDDGLGASRPASSPWPKRLKLQ